MTKGVKVFTASLARTRAELGDLVTEWLALNPNLCVIDEFVTQSSDSHYHCLTITLVYEAS